MNSLQPLHPILGIGTVVMDHVVVLPATPAPNTKCAIQTSWRQVGGPTAVALSVAAHYQATTHFCGRWGNDAEGAVIQTELTRRGIDLTLCKSDNAWNSGFAQVWIDAGTGERTIAYTRGDFAAPHPDEIADSPALNNCRLLHLDGTFPEAALYAAQKVRSQGGRVVLDAGSKKPGMEELLPLVDVLIASEEFCRRWFDTPEVSLQQLKSLGPTIAIQTLGDRGAVFDEGSGTVSVPAVPVTAVDTNGAGDIFSGALIYSLACDQSIERSIEFANAAASYACGHQGNSTWMPLE